MVKGTGVSEETSYYNPKNTPREGLEQWDVCRSDTQQIIGVLYFDCSLMDVGYYELVSTCTVQYSSTFVIIEIDTTLPISFFCEKERRSLFLYSSS